MIALLLAATLASAEWQKAQGAGANKPTKDDICASFAERASVVASITIPSYYDQHQKKKLGVQILSGLIQLDSDNLDKTNKPKLTPGEKMMFLSTYERYYKFGLCELINGGEMAKQELIKIKAYRLCQQGLLQNRDLMISTCLD